MCSFQFNPSVAALALACLLATAAVVHASDPCIDLKHNVDSILAIGPWASTLVVLTTNYQLFNGPFLRGGQLRPGKVVQLRTQWPALFKVLANERFNRSTVNLLAISKRRFLYSNGEQVWLITDGIGIGKSLTFPGKGTIWAMAAQEDQFYALGAGGGTLDKYTLDETNQFTKTASWKLCPNGTLMMVNLKQKCSFAGWTIKKAFLWKGRFFILTTDSVYSFPWHGENEPASGIALTKMPYDAFIECSNASDSKQGLIGKGSSSHSKKFIFSLIGIISAVVLLLLVLGLIICLVRSRGREKGQTSPASKSGNHSRKAVKRSSKGGGGSSAHPKKKHGHEGSKTRHNSRNPSTHKVTSHSKMASRQGSNAKARVVSRKSSKAVPSHWTTNK